MTAATDEAWIQNSLARLEALEAQREQLAAAGDTAKLAEIDEEIQGLYEALEAVADDDDGDAPANEAAPVAPVAQAAPVAAAAAPVAAAAAAIANAPADPFGAPPAASAPMTASPITAGGMEPAIDYAADDLDIKPPRSSLPIILVVLLILGGGGAGAYFFYFNKKKEEPKAEPTGPAVVIEASEVVEDTQEPVVAKGADADRTRGTNFKEGSKASTSRPSGKRSGSSSGSTRPRSSKKDEGRKVDVDAQSNDPLAGI